MDIHALGSVTKRPGQKPSGLFLIGMHLRYREDALHEQAANPSWPP
jgi:hypothetical protein